MVELFRMNSNLCDHNSPTSQTDGRTDGQTTCDRNTALCTKVHRAVKTNYEREMIACIDVIMITLKYTLSVIKACNLIYVTNLASLLTKPLTYRVRHSHVLRLLLWKLDNVSYSIPPIVLTMHKVCSFAVKIVNKKAVLPQGNRTMPQVFFSVEVRQQHSLLTSIRLAVLRKPRFRAPNMLAQNTI